LSNPPPYTLFRGFLNRSSQERRVLFSYRIKHILLGCKLSQEDLNYRCPSLRKEVRRRKERRIQHQNMPDLIQEKLFLRVSNGSFLKRKTSDMLS